MIGSMRVCGLSSSLQCPSPSGSIRQRRLECLRCRRWITLLQQQLSQLFAGGNDRPRSDWKLFDSVLVISRAAQDGSSFTGSIRGLDRPSHDLAPHNIDLCRPVAISGRAKPIFKLTQRLGFSFRLLDMAASCEAEAARQTAMATTSG